MISGHLAVGLALKKADKGLGLGAVLVAATAPDIVLGILILLGTESVNIPGSSARPGYLVFTSPYSHSLASGLIATAVFYALGRIVFRSSKRALILGVAAAAHYAVDLVFFIPGLPVFWDGQNTIGIGLWRWPEIALGVEVLIFAAGLGVFLKASSPQRRKVNRYTIAAMAVFIAALAIGGQWLAPAGMQKIDVGVLLIALPVIAIAIGFWLDPTDCSDYSTGKERRQISTPDEYDVYEEDEFEEDDGDEDEDENKPLWPPERVELTNRLWGEDITTPGGVEYIIEFVQLLALSEAKSLLNLGAGFGGAARALTKRYGVWVTAFEALDEMAVIGIEKSKMAGMGKKSPIKRYDPESPKFKKNGFNAVVALESLYTVKDKEGIIKAIEKSLRTDGTLLFTDFVLNEDGPLNEAVSNWCKVEPVSPNLVTVNHLASLIKDCPLLNLYVASDITADYRSRVINDWVNFVKTLTKGELTPSFFDLVIRECEYWAWRIAALDSGQLRVCRFEAIKRPPPRADVASLKH